MTAEQTVVRSLLVVIGLLIALPFLLMASATRFMGVGGWGHMAAGDGGWGLGIWLAVLLLFAGIAYFLFVRIPSGRHRAPDTALEELRTAYARGDLSDEEFERRFDNLHRDSRP